MVGLFIFTIVPLVTMILIAFTNYDAGHEVPQHLFEWVKYDEPARELDGVDVSTIEWRFSNSYAAKMTYNPETNKYTNAYGSNYGQR